MTDSDSHHSALPVEKPHRTRDMRSSGKLSELELRQLGIVYASMEDIALLNAYRDLRSKLVRLAGNANFVCLVCALAPGDDSSRLSINLGAVVAFDQQRSSIVIDCDAEPNVIDKLAMTQDRPGLTEFIEQEMDDIAALIGESGIDRVRIVSCGDVTHTRTETLESARMNEIIVELKERYPDRFLFINAPSMRLSSEVQILANVSDMVLFQVTPGLVTEQQVTEAVELIGADKVAGVVLRDV